MSVPPIGLFSAWKAPLSAYDPDPRQFQEVIFYCASRFRATAISLANGPPKDWFQLCFLAEVVHAASSVIACIDWFYLTQQQFCLAYIGMAAAIGQSVDIPLIV